MSRHHYSYFDKKVFKAVKLRKLHYNIIIFFVFFYIFFTIGFSGEYEHQSKIEIGILDFHYIYDGGYIPKNSFRKIIEKHILIPSLNRELKEYNISNQNVILKKVSHGNLDFMSYANSKQYSDKELYKSYDILLWGQVLPLEWPNDYDLNIFLFTNSNKYEPTTFYFFLKIRNGRIISWNHRPCDFPEETIGVIPSSFCYKIAKMRNENDQKSQSKQVNKKILQRFKLYGALFPINYIKEIIEWYPDKKMLYPTTAGSIELFLANDEYINLNLSNNIYNAIESLILLDKPSNWRLERSSLMLPDIILKTDSSEQDFANGNLRDFYPDLKLEDKIIIGIFPFENMTKKDKYNWIGFGLEYLLSNKLSHVSVLNVLDQNIIEKALNKSGYNKDKTDYSIVSNAAQATRLDIAITGRYSTISNQVNVDLNFIDTFTESQLFSKQYKKNRNNLFAITDDIANDLIQVTSIHLSNKEEIINNHRITNSIKAFEYFCLVYLEDKKPLKDMKIIIETFKKAVNEDPEFWQAHYNLGIAYFNNKEYKNANNQFSKTIKALPDFEKPYIGRALTLLRKKEYNKAEEDLLTASKLNPNNYKSFYYLGKINVTLQRYTKASKYLTRAAELNPDFGKTYFEIGNIYYAQKNYGFAIRQYEKATQLDPDNIENHKILGECYYRIKNYPSAYNEFKIVLADNPNDADANFMMGITEYQQAVLEKYIEDFFNNVDNTTKQTRENKSDIILGKRHQVYNKMVARFYKAQKLKKNFFEATFNLALTFQEMGNLNNAIIYYNKTVKINPFVIQAHLALIKIYEEKNEKEKALKKYKDVARIEPGLFATYPQLGEFYDNINIIDVVTKELEEVLMTNPRDIESNLTLARIFYAQGYIGRAAKIYRNILSIYPNNENAKKMLVKLKER